MVYIKLPYSTFNYLCIHFAFYSFYFIFLVGGGGLGSKFCSICCLTKSFPLVTNDVFHRPLDKRELNKMNGNADTRQTMSNAGKDT